VSDKETNNSVSVGTTPTKIAAPQTTRKGLLVQNLGTGDICVGDVNVTMSNGIRIPAGDSLPLGDFAGQLYGITTAGTQDVRWLAVA
jgi:hypothetical protein